MAGLTRVPAPALAVRPLGRPHSAGCSWSMIVALAVEAVGRHRTAAPSRRRSPLSGPSPIAASPRSAPRTGPRAALVPPEAFGPRRPTPPGLSGRHATWSRCRPSPSRIRSTSPVDRSSTWARRTTSTSSSSAGRPARARCHPAVAVRRTRPSRAPGPGATRPAVARTRRLGRGPARPGAAAGRWRLAAGPVSPRPAGGTG